MYAGIFDLILKDTKHHSYSLRGQQLFTSLFADTQPSVAKQEGKGRCASLNAQRDTLLLYRFCYYGQGSQLRYEVILNKLCSEFFLTTRRVQDIIGSNSLQLRNIRSDMPSIAKLRLQYPHLKW